MPNRNARDRNALQRIALNIREGNVVKTSGPCEFEPPKENNNAGEQYTAEGALKVVVDDDIDVSDIGTDILSKPDKGRRTKPKDVERYFKWQLNDELRQPGARQDSIRRRDISHARSHDEFSAVTAKIAEMAKMQEEALILGFDTEGENPETGGPATMQLSARVGGRRLDAVIQMYSLRKMPTPAHVFQEGFPEALKELFCIPNVIFAGQNVAEDIVKTVQAAGLGYDDVKRCAILDTSRLFNLADALARDGDAVEDWLFKDGSGVLGVTSLKNFCQLVNPLLILDKSPSHRNHLADFSEIDGFLTEKDLCYAGLDPRRTMESVLGFAVMVGIPAPRLASSVAQKGQLNDSSVEEALEMFAAVGFSDTAEFEEAIRNVPEDLRNTLLSLYQQRLVVQDAMSDSQDNILRYRGLKMILCRKMKVERDGVKLKKVCEIVRTPPSDKRVFPSSPLHPRYRPRTVRGSVRPCHDEIPFVNRSETVPDPDSCRESSPQVIVTPTISTTPPTTTAAATIAITTPTTTTAAATIAITDSFEPKSSDVRYKYEQMGARPKIKLSQSITKASTTITMTEKPRRISPPRRVTLENEKDSGWLNADFVEEKRLPISNGIVEYVITDSEEDKSDDPMEFKRGKKRKKVVSQTTEVARVLEGEINGTQFVQHDKVVIVSTASCPDLSEGSKNVAPPSSSSPLPPLPVPHPSKSSPFLTSTRSLMDINIEPVSFSPSGQVRSRPSSASNRAPPAPVPVPKPGPPLVPNKRCGTQPHPKTEDYDRGKMQKTYTQLVYANPSEFRNILRPLCSKGETVAMKYFHNILSEVHLHQGKKKGLAYGIATAMISFLPCENRRFIFRILENDLLGPDRLNAVVRLGYFCISPYIILQILFSEQVKHHQKLENVKTAVSNFSGDAVLSVLRFLIENYQNPEAVIARMK